MAVRLILACVMLLLAAFAVMAGERGVVPSAFATDGSHHVYVRVSINDAKPVWMLLDTGTSPSTIDRDYARSIGLTLGRERNIGKGVGGDAIPIAKASVAQLRIGGTRRDKVAFEAMPFRFTAPDGEIAVGVIGRSALTGRTLVLDYPARQVRLTEDSGLAACRCGAPIKLPYGIPSVRAALGGRTIDTIIDSGGSYDVLITPPGASRLGLIEAMNAGQASTGHGYGGGAPIRSGPGPALKVGDQEKPATAITYIALPIKIDAALGTWFLKDYRTTIDYRARRVLFEPAPSPPRTPR